MTSAGGVYIVAGTASENLLLAVVSLDLGTTYTAAGVDANRTPDLLGLLTGVVPMGVIPVGRWA
jgi:nitroreductase